MTNEVNTADNGLGAQEEAGSLTADQILSFSDNTENFISNIENLVDRGIDVVPDSSVPKERLFKKTRKTKKSKGKEDKTAEKDKKGPNVEPSKDMDIDDS
eukprot:COSAG01_NODE_6540_length_3615_cov_7.991115_1_plen_99_part_10